MHELRELITTALDVLGLVLVAAGLVFFLWPHIGGAALACAGFLLMLGSAFASRPTRTPTPQNTEAEGAQ